MVTQEVKIQTDPLPIIPPLGRERFPSDILSALVELRRVPEHGGPTYLCDLRQAAAGAVLSGAGREDLRAVLRQGTRGYTRFPARSRLSDRRSSLRVRTSQTPYGSRDPVSRCGVLFQPDLRA